MKVEFSEGDVRVAVTVFATVRAIDSADGSSIAQVAIRQALSTGMRLPVEIKARIGGEEIPVQIVGVMETGMAAGNGYLWVEPTSKAYREGGAM